ncbi:MAG: hypothetical protein C7N36_21335 [Bacteroidetes bacterium]|nr:MAG: hypothetical protein C7N36_21335 [Bacteroidota bacterium]
MQFTIKSKDLNQAAIKAIQDRFGDANLVINVAQESNLDSLTEEQCWRLIDLLDWDASDDDDRVIAPLVKELANENISHIYQFADWLAQKLWLLDTPAHAENLIKQDGFLSVDDFLYARCAVVANGKVYFDSVLKNPTRFPTTVTFLPLLHTPLIAYQQKKGEEIVYVPLYNYETYGNKTAWGR